MKRIWAVLVFAGILGGLSSPAEAETGRWVEVVHLRQIQCARDEWQGEEVRYLQMAALVRDSGVAAGTVHHQILRWDSRRGPALEVADLCADISRAFREGKGLRVQADSDGWIRSLHAHEVTCDEGC